MKELYSSPVKGITSGEKVLDFCGILKISQSLVQQVPPVICTQLALWQKYDAIQEQVAQGQGEHLEAIARFSGCTEPVTEIFKGELAQNYQTLFSSQNNPVALRNQISVVIQNNEELRTSCQGSEFITS